jgi:hypothetical protein
MLEYQKSRGRRTALGPDVPVFLRHPEEERPSPCKHVKQRIGWSD